MKDTKNNYKLFTWDFYRGQRYVVVVTVEGFFQAYVEVPRSLSSEVYPQVECHGGITGETRYIRFVDIEADSDHKFLVFHTGHENDLPHITTIEDCFEDHPNLDNYITSAAKMLVNTVENYNEYAQDAKPRAITPEEVVAECHSVIDQLEKLGTYSL